MKLNVTFLVFWMVRYGVDRSHCTESTGVLHKKKFDAIVEFEGLALKRPFLCKELIRIVFPRTPMAVASETEVVRREIKP